MKLNWFSPLPPAKTDIAHYTKRLLPALSTVAEVTLWTEQRTWDRELENYAEVRSYRNRGIRWLELNRADMTVYQMGNNPRFHGTLWEISRLHGGVVVLHDLRLHHFFDGLYRVKYRDKKTYLALMQKYYGEQGREDGAICYRNNARNIDYMAQQYPLTELAVENALGVLVHTEEALKNLTLVGNWPLAYAPLVFSAPAQTRRRTNNRPPYNLILFGYIGSNRRLDALLRALSELDEKDQFHLNIYGSVLSGERHVHREIRALGIKSHVTLHGFVNETQLDEALSEADLAINLRFPTMGEASGSQLRIWAHALPSLVSDVGWYASLPRDTVALVHTGERETPDIKKYMRAFLADPNAFQAMGQKGLALLRKDHTPAAYAATVFELAKQASAYRARAASLSFAGNLGGRVANWFDGSTSENMLRRIADQIFALVES
ncbi:MAG TPA: glycosyltransferase [Pyrinomonadaceae bacterium]|nr:glycosyltransferase [Pyrinomonadaceae bacterium]